MTYFGFLGVFLAFPILLLWGLAARDARRGRYLPPALKTWPSWVILLTHMVIAVVYTTPWDNYLVATRVWWYNPELVTGVIIGYVPIEEYTFFVLQPVLTGSWLLLLARHSPVKPPPLINGLRLRRVATLLVGIIWLGALSILIVGWKPGTYLGLLLAWALPPVMLQLAFGADILWSHRRLVFLSIVPMTLYLSAADKLAISSGTWTINPEQSVNIFLLGRLPLEEFIFFLMTNTLIVLGVTLFTSADSKARAERYARALRRLIKRQQPTAARQDRLQAG